MTFSVNTFETNPGEGNFSFAFHEKLSEGQELYFIAHFPPSTIDAKSFAESVFGAIVDNFEESETQDAYDLFEESLKMANSEMEKRKNQLQSIPEIVVAFFDFHNLYISQSGEAEVYLIRENVLSQITETPEDHLLFSNILSGEVSVHDTLIISSNRLLRVLTAQELVDIFQNDDYEESVSTLKQDLRTKTTNDLLLSIIGVGRATGKPKKATLLSKVVPTKKKEELLSPIDRPSPKPTLQKLPPQEEIPVPKTPDPDPLPSPENPAEEEEAGIDSDSFEKTPEKTAEVLLENPTPKKKFSFSFAWPSFSFKKPTFSIKSPRKVIIALLTIIVVLGLTITIRISQKKSSEIEQSMIQQLATVRGALQRSDELLLQGDRKGANEALVAAEKVVNKVFNEASDELRSQAKFLKADIESKKLQAENAFQSQSEIIADLSAKHPGIEVLGMEYLRGNLFAYDTTSIYKTIRSIVENGIEITTQEALLSSAVRPEQDTLLFLTSTPRIIEYRNGVTTPMNTADKVWQKGVDLDTFGSRYIYILDPVQNQIWRYERRRADYSERNAYNKNADLSRAVSMSIDGSIFILSDDGSIQKLFRGEKQEYSFRDLPSLAFTGKNLRLYTTPTSGFLYILDPDHRRILIFQKGDRFATYKKQVLFDDISNAVDFYIHDSGQRANIITPEKIYEFDL